MNKFVEGNKQLSSCVTCKHKHEDATCKAFPYGIPEPILDGSHDHKTEYPNDKGIRYEHD